MPRIVKKDKVKAVVARPEKNAKKMSKLMKKMNLEGGGIKQKLKNQGGDSESSDEESDDGQMEGVTVMATKQIKKKKVLSKSYYQELKKNLRRMVKDGRAPDIAKLDKMLAAK